MTIPEQQTSAARHGVNTIVPGRILQRGQILTWSYEDKQTFFKRNRIGLVVNFWCKADPDMSNFTDITYIYMPRVDSGYMLRPDVELLADMVGRWLAAYPDHTVLSLCEAGRGRSVAFAVMLTQRLQGGTLAAAYDTVNTALNGKHSLKPYLVKHFQTHNT